MSQSPNRRAMRIREQRFENLRAKRKLRRLTVLPTLFADILQHGASEIKPIGLPDDAICAGWTFNPITDTMEFIFAHESFSPVTSGDVIPRFEPEVKSE